MNLTSWHILFAWYEYLQPSKKRVAHMIALCSSIFMRRNVLLLYPHNDMMTVDALMFIDVIYAYDAIPTDESHSTID
jgi:hypothetical protein